MSKDTEYTNAQIDELKEELIESFKQACINKGIPWNSAWEELLEEEDEQ